MKQINKQETNKCKSKKAREATIRTDKITNTFKQTSKREINEQCGVSKQVKQIKARLKTNTFKQSKQINRRQTSKNKLRPT